MFPIRAVEDDHVDRTGVEAWQHVKLTVTNSSIDFFVPIEYVHQAKLDDIIFMSSRANGPADGAPSGYFAKAKTRGDGLASCMAAKLNLEQGRQTDQSKKDVLN